MVGLSLCPNRLKVFKPSLKEYNIQLNVRVLLQSHSKDVPRRNLIIGMRIEQLRARQTVLA